MSPAERLQAAIDKLTRLKAASAIGPWKVTHRTFPGHEPYAADIDSLGLLDVYDGNVDIRIADVRDLDDATLIVTLHRTIDPILTALRSAVEWLAEGNNAAIAAGSSIFAAQLGPELALADAILGGAE